MHLLLTGAKNIQLKNHERNIGYLSSPQSVPEWYPRIKNKHLLVEWVRVAGLSWQHEFVGASVHYFTEFFFHLLTVNRHLITLRKFVSRKIAPPPPPLQPLYFQLTSDQL